MSGISGCRRGLTPGSGVIALTPAAMVVFQAIAAGREPRVPRRGLARTLASLQKRGLIVRAGPPASCWRLTDKAVRYRAAGKLSERRRVGTSGKGDEER